jgi:hypothetical protein
LISRTKKKQISTSSCFITEINTLMVKLIKWMRPPSLQIFVGVFIIALDLDPCSHDEHGNQFHDPPGDRIDPPGPQALTENRLPIVIVAVTVHPAHVIARIERIIVLRALILTGEFGFGSLGGGLAEDIEKVK